MRVLGLAIDKSMIGFKRYVSGYGTFARCIQNQEIMNQFVSHPDLKRLAKATKIVELDAKFKSLLNEKEIEVLSYLAYHTIVDKKPDNYQEIVDTMYQKWVSVFFDEQLKLVNKINAPALGAILMKIRKHYDIAKTKLARDMGLNRNTIAAFENGKRIPPLDYMYKFSQMFKISIDEIIELSLNVVPFKAHSIDALF